MSAAPRPRPLGLLGAIASALLLLACEGPSTQLIVVVTSDYPADELRSVSAVVSWERGRAVTHAFNLVADEVGAIRPLSFGLAPRTEDPVVERVTLEVSGYSERDGVGCLLSSRRLTTGFVPGRVLRLRVALDRSCLAGCSEELVDPARLEPVEPGRELEGIDGGVSPGSLPDRCAMDAGGSDGGSDGGADGGADAGDALTPLAPLRQLAVGDHHSCVLLESGALWCWGSNEHGQILFGGELAYPTPVEVPLVIGGAPLAVARIALGAQGSCAVLETGELFCWGLNAATRFERGGDPTATLPPTRVAADVGSVALAPEHLCWVDEGVELGSILCQGVSSACQSGPCGTTAAGDDSQCSLSGVNCRNMGVITVPEEPFVQVTAGPGHTCGRTESGKVYCWGTNDACQLGSGGPTDMSGCASQTWKATQIPELAEQIDISAGAGHTCGLHGTDGLLCWGSNADSQLGRSRIFITRAAVPLEPTRIPPGVLQHSSSSSGTHACVRTSDNQVWCWGRNDFGQAGTGELSVPVESATLIPRIGLAFVDEIQVGAEHSCARSPIRVRCWGRGTEGQLGDGVMATRALTDNVLSAWNAP